MSENTENTKLSIRKISVRKYIPDRHWDIEKSIDRETFIVCSVDTCKYQLELVHPNTTMITIIRNYDYYNILASEHYNNNHAIDTTEEILLSWLKENLPFVGKGKILQVMIQDLNLKYFYPNPKTNYYIKDKRWNVDCAKLLNKLAKEKKLKIWKAEKGYQGKPIIIDWMEVVN